MVCHHPIKQIKNLIYYSPGLGAATVTNYSAVSTQGNNNVGATQEKVPTSDKPSQQWLVLPVKFTIHPTLPPLCLHVFVIMGKPLFLMLYGKSARLPVTATYDMLLDDTNKGSSVAPPNVYAKALFGIFFTMAPPAHRPLPPAVCFRQIPVSKVELVLRSCLLKKCSSFIITEYSRNANKNRTCRVLGANHRRYGGVRTHKSYLMYCYCLTIQFCGVTSLLCEKYKHARNMPIRPIIRKTRPNWPVNRHQIIPPNHNPGINAKPIA